MIISSLLFKHIQDYTFISTFHYKLHPHSKLLYNNHTLHQPAFNIHNKLLLWLERTIHLFIEGVRLTTLLTILGYNRVILDHMAAFQQPKRFTTRNLTLTPSSPLFWNYCSQLPQYSLLLTKSSQFMSAWIHCPSNYGHCQQACQTLRIATRETLGLFRI